MEQPILQVINLSHRYSVQWAVRGINFEISSHGIYGLLGSNGAGKSTTMNIICGVLKQTEGDVYIDGINFKDNSIEAKKRIGFLPQTPPLYMDFTINEYLTYCADLRMVDKTNVKEAVNKDMKVINLLDVLGSSVKEEEVVEGMEAEEEEEKDGAEEEPEYDEHVWLSLRNAKVLCKAIADDLAEIDTENADTYQKNEKAYTDKLDELDKKYQETVDSASQKTLLFGDRFPFRYMVDDYGLNYYAAFVGCSAETEASFETITFLAGKTDELGLKNIMTIEKSDQKIAKTIIENTKEKNQGILTLDSMQSTTSDDVKKGATYFSIMENNLNVLQEALQ